MKYVTNILFFLLFSLNAFGQTRDQSALWKNEVLNDSSLNAQEYRDSLESFNIGRLWTQTDNSEVFGFIGPHYQRLRVKILSAKKNRDNPDTYTIKGKCMIRDIVFPFAGTIRIVTARTLKTMNTGVDDGFLNKGIKHEGVLVAEYSFAEDSIFRNSGRFSGVLATWWYINRNGKLKYDDIENYSDGYCNNQFVGIWQEYGTGAKKTCNWGDYRIPYSGSLDAGAGEFYPADQYLKYGWKTRLEAMDGNNKQAQTVEDEKWWK